ncbi:hypothetical protein SPV1_05317 [Mariprofundus ferrooxydans PV-1]|uniref:Uncharacterized protein n=1 Tax=Mariprofundus ferrooxydans PV-1 TaxID=314345 RepID=Q0EY72_9PROT|nr:hypothetical protein SPV1_05317 [Mariprofundus ferrooxydans PV-1]
MAGVIKADAAAMAAIEWLMIDFMMDELLNN